MDDADGDKIATVRRSFELISAADLDGLLELYGTDVEFLPVTGTRVESGGYHGHQGVRDYFEEVAPIWEAMTPYGTDFQVIGDAVVVYGGCMVRGRGSGAETDAPMAWVVTVTDGKIVSHRGFGDPESALAAAEAGAEDKDG
jgi:ketosteroid isomerase-like protein